MHPIFERLKERKLVRWGLAYAAGAVALFGVISEFGGPWGVTDGFLRTTQVVLVLGLFVVLVVAWYHGEQGRQRISGPELLIITGLVAVAGLLGRTLVEPSGDEVRLGPAQVEPFLRVSQDAAIAVLPFRVQGTDMEVWREGIVDALSSYLDGVSGLRAIDARTLMAQWPGVSGSAEEVDLGTALDVARSVGARHALVGAGVRSGDRVRFTGDVYDVADRTSLALVQSEGEAADAMQLVDRLGAETVIALGDAGLELVPGVQLAELTTASPSALLAYLEGEAHYRRGEWIPAATALRRAIEADSSFALAHFRLGFTCSWTFTCEGSEQSLGRALALGLPEREALPARAWIAISDGSLSELEALRVATLRYPDDPEVWEFFGEHHFHLGEAAALKDGLAEAERIFDRVLDLDPGFVPAYQHPVAMAFWRGDQARAAQLIDAVGAADPGGPWERFYRELFSLGFGEDQDAASIRLGVDRLQAMEPEGLPTFGLLRDEYLAHPMFAALESEVSSRVPEEERNSEDFCLQRLLGPGRLDQLIAYALDTSRPRDSRLTCLYGAVGSGLPVPESAVAAVVSAFDVTPRALAEDGSWAGLWLGAYAAAEERWEDQEAFMLAYREVGASRPGSNQAAIALLLEAYGTWRRGRPADAIERIEAVPLDVLPPTVRWWLGELYEEVGRLEDAARMFDGFRSWFRWSHALHRLGRVYESIGVPDPAIAAYTEFVEAWSAADPSLQPLVQASRDRLAALASN